MNRDLARFHGGYAIAATGCWEWSRSCNNRGYGWFRFRGRLWLAHRAAYELLVGPIPEGMELDHLCRTRACVNPDHLEPVTHRENSRRAHAIRTHCAQGHEFTIENTRVTTSGVRKCRECARAWNRGWRAA